MEARFDHLVLAVSDLDQAAGRWAAVGLAAEPGGLDSAGRATALVRGPEAAYVELVAADGGRRGPISWAIVVDDVDAARATLVAAGFDPQPVTDGSRTAPTGHRVTWRSCTLGPGPFDPDLPFLIQWMTPMPAGPDDGPELFHVALSPRDIEAVADVLLALGFAGDDVWPRRAFYSGTGPSIHLLPMGEPQLSSGARVMVTVVEQYCETEQPTPASTHLSVTVPRPGLGEVDLDGVRVSWGGDRRQHEAAALLPAVEDAFGRLRGDLADWPDPHPGRVDVPKEAYSRVLDPGKYALAGIRARAWVEAITSAGLGVAEEVSPGAVCWRSEPPWIPPDRVVVVTGAPGTQALVVALSGSDGLPGSFVTVGVGDPVEALLREPDCGCDACDSGSQGLMEAIDAGFLTVLNGGVYAVRDGDAVVTRTLDGWEATDVEDPDQWLEEAESGRRTEGVTKGEPWGVGPALRHRPLSG